VRDRVVVGVLALGGVRLRSPPVECLNMCAGCTVQVLLTYDCFGNRSQYLNARNSLTELLNMGVVPIINENDVVAVQELMFGDNDSLGAHVAGIVGAHWYIMFTDVHAVYSGDPRVSCVVCINSEAGTLSSHSSAVRQRAISFHPRLLVSAAIFLRPAQTNPSAVPIRIVPDISALRLQLGFAGGAAEEGAKPVKSGKFGTGGMQTKLVAAQLATAAGVTTVICHNSDVNQVEAIMAVGCRVWCCSTATVTYRVHVRARPPSPCSCCHLRLHRAPKSVRASCLLNNPFGSESVG
jgi:glutamate 5-kinase